MRVLTIYSAPQEWGDPQLDFIDLEHGQIVQSISMLGADYPDLDYREWKEPTGELETHHVSFITADKVDEFKVGREKYSGVIVESVITRDKLIPDKEFYDAQIVVERYAEKCDYFYNEDNDTFGHYLKSIGIDIPWNSPERQDIHTLISMIGEALGYDIVNTLYYQ